MSARPTACFLAKHAGGSFNPSGGGLVSAAIESDAGARIFRDNGIADPASNLAFQLSDDLRRRYGLQLEQQTVSFSDDDPTQIAVAYPAADLVLDVRIDNLSVAPFSQTSSRYGLQYAAYVRLIDAKVVRPLDGKRGLVIAHGTCIRKSEETSGAPTYDELLGNQARRLKADLAEAVRFCVDEFRTKVLTASSSP